MRVLKNSRGLVIGAPAKVNLFLELLGKRTDGYHELVTLMVALSLHDTLAIVDSADGDIGLTCDRPTLSTAADNLIVKAARLLKSRTGTRRGAAIRLKKRIPMAAGLGGGSSDAAATLVGLNRLWKLNQSLADLSQMAAELGSDVPFFLTPLAGWCTGRGEIVEPLAVPRAFDIVLVFPPLGCETARVYRHVELPAQPRTGDAARAAAVNGDAEQLAAAMFNRLEPAAETVAPQLRNLRETIAAAVPLGCRMSGSGSTLLTIARNADEARSIVQLLQALPALAGCGIRAVRTLTSRSFQPARDKE